MVGFMLVVVVATSVALALAVRGLATGGAQISFVVALAAIAVAGAGLLHSWTMSHDWTGWRGRPSSRDDARAKRT